jgi:hypothetical protein
MKTEEDDEMITWHKNVCLEGTISHLIKPVLFAHIFCVFSFIQQLEGHPGATCDR